MRALRSSLVMLALCTSAACGRDNETACQNYVDAANRAYAECNDSARLDPDETCPEGLNASRDCTEYYDRLAESASCESDGSVTFDATGECN